MVRTVSRGNQQPRTMRMFSSVAPMMGPERRRARVTRAMPRLRGASASRDDDDEWCAASPGRAPRPLVPPPGRASSRPAFAFVAGAVSEEDDDTRAAPPPATLPLPLTHPSRAPPRLAEKPSLHRDAALFGPGGRERWEREAEARVRARGGVAPPRWASSSPSSPGGVIPPSPPPPRFALVRSPHPPAPGDVIPWYEDPGPSSAALPIARAGRAPPTRRPDDARGPRGRPRARPGGDRPTPRARRRRPQSASDATRNRPGRHPKAPSDRTPRDETRRTGGESGGGSGERSGRGERVRAAAPIRRLVERVEPVVGERGGVAGVGAAGPRAESAGSPRDDGGGEPRAWARPPRSEASAPVSPRGGLMERNGVEFAAMARLERATRPRGRPGPSGGRATVILRRRRE